MRHTLLFIGAIIGLLSIVPLSTFAATGRWSDAWFAAKGYLLCIGALAGLAFILSAFELVSMLLTA